MNLSDAEKIKCAKCGKVIRSRVDLVIRGTVTLRIRDNVFDTLWSTTRAITKKDKKNGSVGWYPFSGSAKNNWQPTIAQVKRNSFGFSCTGCGYVFSHKGNLEIWRAIKKYRVLSKLIK